MLQLGYERFYMPHLRRSISGLSKPTKDEESVLQHTVQSKVECKRTWLLGRKKDSILSKTKQRCKGFKERSLERRQKSRQRRLYTYMATRTPKLRLSWVRKRASFSYRAAVEKILEYRGASSPQRRRQTKQLNRELTGIC